MATHRSALKEHRQSLKRRARNRQHQSRLRTALKRFRAALAAADHATASTLLSPTLSIVDRTAKLGCMHENAAARTKSRLARALNRLRASA